MARLAGIGWIGTTGWGALRTGQGGVFTGDACERHLDQPPAGLAVRNYPRFTRHARLVMHALHLSIRDAWPAGQPVPAGAGLIGVGELGTVEANLDYFRDYWRNGRRLARGNLFLYTLPTSPLAEAALAFQLRGPLYWLQPEERRGERARAFAQAEAALDAGGVPALFICHGHPDRVVLYTAVSESAGGWLLDQAAALVPPGMETGEEHS